jgi:TFIIF-interacting CTD phosphatase-like protein
MKTLVLDMDETLVHCFVGPENGDVHLPFELPNGDLVQGKMNLRPFLKEFLLTMKKHYEVIVFTASH